MVGERAKVLGRLGRRLLAPSKSVCSILPIAICGPGLSGAPAFIYNAPPGRAVFSPSYSARPSLCAPSALRGTSGGATMTTPGGTRMTLCTTLVQFPTRARLTGCYHGVGAPQIPSVVLLLFALPRPDAAEVVLCTLGLRLPNLYIRNIIPDDMGCPRAGDPGLSGRPRALSPRVRGITILGSSGTSKAGSALGQRRS